MRYCTHIAIYNVQRGALFGQILGIVLHVHDISFLKNQSYSCLQRLRDFDISENYYQLDYFRTCL